jgi:hypothetical protein
MQLSRKQIQMLEDVISAARDGRYCHGNGAQWVYVSKSDSNAVISADHVSEKIHYYNKEESERYLAGNRPHRDESTARSLEDFIKSSR